jgi:hypothetical protein
MPGADDGESPRTGQRQRNWSRLQPTEPMGQPLLTAVRVTRPDERPRPPPRVLAARPIDHIGAPKRRAPNADDGRAITAVLGHPLELTSVTSAGIPGCDRVLLLSVGLAPTCHHDLTIHPAKPPLADKVVDERICPIPLPGEPAPQLRLGCDD